MKYFVAACSLAIATQKAFAQTPLADKRFNWGSLPYQADTDDGERGIQYGYNICNSTTQNQDSLCQTAVINSIDDFCLWGPPEPDSLIGDTEGEAVAWCTRPGYGTRLIPEGALTGVQFIKTPDYVQVTGTINQALINIAADDTGGEMDPHGADQRGNPLGGLLFSKAYTGDFVQAVEWHNFMGGGVFCLKACDPAGPDAAHYCEHIFDRIGCYYNAPADYEEGAFLSCLGDSQDFPGIYTDVAGDIQTYTQPPESLGPITSMPYLPATPATSSCTNYQSAELYLNPTPVTITTRSTSSVSSTSSITSASASSSSHTRATSESRSRTGTSTVTVTRDSESDEEGANEEQNEGENEEEGSAASHLVISTGVLGSITIFIASFFAVVL